MLIRYNFQYLDENVHKTYVDVDEMTQSLMTRYMDYSRRKQNPFRASVLDGEFGFRRFHICLTGVLAAYKTVLRSYGIDSNPNSDNENGGSDLEVMDVSDYLHVVKISDVHLF